MGEPLVGLEDVVITTSTICFIDGDKGILRYRGYDVSELGAKSSYEEVSYLLLYGQLPSDAALRQFKEDLRKNRSGFQRWSRSRKDNLVILGRRYPFAGLMTESSSLFKRR